MGVKCSLLGHDYGEADVEREHEERGDEVVRTARRVERCRNCGKERTVSENTEVTSLEAAAGVHREPDGTIVAAANADDGSEVIPSEADGGVTIQEGIAVSPSTGRTPSTSETDTTDTTDSADAIDTVGADATTTRGESDVGSTTRPERAPGEWPTDPGERRPVSASSETDPDRTSASLAATDGPRVRWPDDPTDSGEIREVDDGEVRSGTRVTDYASSSETGADSDAESGVGSTARPNVDGAPGGTFECPSCGFSASVVDSPYRAGDICPGCQQGYLAWETRNR